MKNLILIIMLISSQGFAHSHKTSKKVFKSQFAKAQENLRLTEDFYSQCKRQSQKNAICSMAVLSAVETEILLKELKTTAKKLKNNTTINIMQEDELTFLSKKAVISKSQEMNSDIKRMNSQLKKLGFKYKVNPDTGGEIHIPYKQPQKQFGPPLRTHYVTYELQNFSNMVKAGIPHVQIARIKYIIDKNPQNLLKVLEVERKDPNHEAIRNPSSYSKNILFQKIKEQVKKNSKHKVNSISKK